MVDDDKIKACKVLLRIAKILSKRNEIEILKTENPLKHIQTHTNSNGESFFT